MATDEDKAKGFFSEFRVSRRFSPVRLVLLVLAVAFCLGFIVGYPLVLSGSSEPPIFSYLLAGAFSAFTVWTILDLLRNAPEPHGLYRLVLESGADWLSFLEGWALIGGKVVLAAALGRAFAQYILVLVPVELPPWATLAITACIVLVMSAPNFLGTGTRRLPTLLLALPFFAYGACLIIGRITGVETAFPIEALSAPRTIWASTALALVGFWGLEVALAQSEELQTFHKNLPRVLVAIALIIPLASGTASLLLPHPNTETATWLFWGHWGSSITTGVACLSIAGALWWILLLLGKQGLVMARHGFLPPLFARLHPRLATPVAFHAVSVFAAAALAVLLPSYALVPLAALAWGLLAAGMMLAAVVGYYRLEPAKRSTTLPFFPLVPFLGTAGTLLLLAFLPGRAWLASLVWGILGLTLYASFGVRWRAQKQEGITVFKEAEAVQRPRSAFRILVPVANPATAQHLMDFAVSLARSRDGDIIALQVIEAPAQVSISAGRRLARGHLQTLEAAADRVEQAGVPVRAMTRVARSVSEGILDTAIEEACNLILLGWTGRSRAVPGSLGGVLDPVLDGAACDVVVISGDFPEHLASILIPMAGGPHARKALELAGELIQSTGARITILHILPSEASEKQAAEARQRIEGWLKPISEPTTASVQIIRSDDVVAAIMLEAQSADLIIMGTSSQSWLDRVLFGAVPEEVAQRAKVPVVLARAYTGLARLWGQRIWQALFNLLPTLATEETADLYRALRDGARGNVNYYMLILLSAIIASAGLLSNSAAVIIGAMLVAPFMTPVLALSLGIVLGEARILSQGVESTVKGVGAAVVLGAFITLVFPVSSFTSEIVSRTHPTVLDLLVALASGAAGAYAIARKELAAALPGVAIAAALMPPVCTVGIGIASGSGVVTGGALLLFITNVVAIVLAGAIIFLLLGIRPKPRAKERQERLRRGLALSAVLLLVIFIVLAWITFSASRTSSQQALIQRVLQTELEQTSSGTLVSVDTAQFQQGTWDIQATVEAPSPPSSSQVGTISNVLTQELHEPVRLRLRVILTVEVENDSG